MLKTNTPENIMELDIEPIFNTRSLKEVNKTDNILKYVNDANYRGVLELKHPFIRAKLMKTLIKDIFKLDLSPDYLLAAIAQDNAILVLAPAGAGKSTLAHMRAIDAKLERFPMHYDPIDYKFGRKNSKGFAKDVRVLGTRILCLVYNRENVNSLKSRQRDFANRLNSLVIDKFVEIDEDLNARTFHSICKDWTTTYASQLNLKVKPEPMTGGACVSSMIDAINQTLIRLGTDDIINFGDNKKLSKLNPTMLQKHFANDKVASYLLTLKNSLIESIKYDDVLDVNATDEEREIILSNFTDYYAINLPPKVIKEILSRYTFLKKIKQTLDFSDYLYWAHKLLKDKTIDTSAIYESIEYIIADEVQDYTPVMWEILKMFNKRGTPLFAIGDDDQSIYNFRNVTLEYVINFREHFDNSSVYTLTYNRRCRQRILEEANYHVEKISGRFEKKTLSLKPAGEVEYIPYSGTKSQIEMILLYLNNNSQFELHDRCVCARDNIYVEFIAHYMQKSGVPYRVTGSEFVYTPYTSELYNHLFSILNMLDKPYDKEYRKCLYKITPVNKNDWFLTLGFDASKGKFGVPKVSKSFIEDKGILSETTLVHFKSLDYSPYMNIKGFVEIMKFLLYVSTNISTLPMKQYMPTLLEFFRSYFWNLRKRSQDSKSRYEEITDILEQETFELFDTDLTYPIFLEQIKARREKYRDNVTKRRGVALSTFHKLKGLEYKENIATFLDSNIFPNYEILESQGVTPDVMLESENGDRRLWYVTITRAIDKFTSFYNKKTPSAYVAERIGVSPEEEDIVDNNNYISSQELYETFRVQTEEEIHRHINNTEDNVVVIPIEPANTLDLSINSEIELIDVELNSGLEGLYRGMDNITYNINTAIESVKLHEEATDDLYQFDAVDSDIKETTIICKDVKIDETKEKHLQSKEISCKDVNSFSSDSKEKQSDLNKSLSMNPFLANTLKKLGGE